MVLFVNEGFNTAIGSIFPVEGAWSSLLGALVGIRVLLYALTTEPSAEPLKDKWNIIIYFLTLFYFGPAGLVIILLLQVMRRVAILEKIASKLPVQEHNPKEMVTIILAAFVAWFFSTPQFSWVENYFPLRILYMSSWGWILILLAMLYYLPSREKDESREFKRTMQAALILYVLTILVFGFDLLYIFFVYLLLKPFLGKIYGRLKGTIREKAEAEAKGEIEEGKPGLLAQLFKAYSVKEAEERRKEMEQLMGRIDDIEAKKKGDIEKLSAQLAAERNADIEALEDNFKEHSKHVPGLLRYLLAIIAAIANDISDFSPMGIPGINILIDILAVIFMIWFILPVMKLDGISKGTKGFVTVLVIFELIPYVSLVPWWFIIIMFLNYKLKQTQDYKAMESAKKHLRERGAAAPKTFGLPISVNLHGFMIKLAAATVLVLAAGLILPLMGINVGQQALAAQRYVSSGQWLLDAQQYAYEMQDRIRDIIIAPKVWWEMQLEIFNQDAFISQVDQSAQRKLGLFWEDLRPAERRFETGREAIVWGALRGEILDISKCLENRSDPQCIVRTGCRVQNALGIETTPKEISMLDLAGSGESITCSFTPAKEGVYKITFVSEFDFETRAYIPMYFADRNLVLAYTEKGADILDEAGITNKKPVAVSTPGPIAVGIEAISALPLRVDIPVSGTGAVIAGPGQGTTIGVSLQNTWRPRGRLEKINNLIVTIPRSMRLEDCTPADFIEMPPQYDNDTERNYQIAPAYAAKEIGEEETKSFRCILTAAAAPEDILTPGAEVTLRPIKVIADYKFVVSADTSIQVRPGEAGVALTYTKVQEDALDDYDICPSGVEDCSYASKQLCDSDPCNQNCYWYYGPATIDRCASCPQADCSIYWDEQYCALDPCDLGCDWDIGEQECVRKNIGSTIKWPTEIFTVDQCGADYASILGVRYVYAVESGHIVSSQADKIEIQHPDGYKSTYSGLLERYRDKGNVGKSAVIGRLSEKFNFRLSTPEKQLSGKEIVDFYEDKLGFTVQKPEGCE